jgi:hypothetical protein
MSFYPSIDFIEFTIILSIGRGCWVEECLELKIKIANHINMIQVQYQLSNLSPHQQLQKIRETNKNRSYVENLCNLDTVVINVIVNLHMGHMS